MASYTSPEHSTSYESQYVATGSGLDERDFGRDLVQYLKDYARERPEVVALWCLGIGFVLGWKLKPW
jgi:hypothetical protein